jgi:hypothetical protein
MTTSDRVDKKYYQAMPAHSLSERLAIAARDRIYDDFVRCCRPGPHDTILDVGVSDVINDAANMLERKYPYPDRVTALGLGEGTEFRAAFPQTAYVRIEPNQRMPFADKSFTIAASNAVLEHVGSARHQALFVGELMRVAHKVFISVPHRYFPVEHHTGIPFLHFWDRTFAPACRYLGKSEWTDERNLILMSRGRLKSLGPSHGVIAHTGLKLGPLSSNLMLFIDDAKTS